MMLTAKGRYAVMAMVDVALNEAAKPVNLADISERQEITVPYLEQIFCKLKGAGLVTSVRGPGGGYKLAQARETITIAHIVHAVEEQIKMTRCEKHSGGCMQTKTKCLTHDLWDGLGNSIEGYLQSVSLEDVCTRNLTKNKVTEKLNLQMGAQ